MWKKLLVCFLALILLTGTVLTVTREYAPVASAEEAQTLPAPTLKSLKATSGGIQITWSAVEGADRYQIWRSTKHNTGFGRIITVTGTSYVDKTAKMNKPYYYYIRPVNEAGAGAKSNVKGHYRAFGPKITTAVKSGSIVLSWNAPAGATSYSLYRAENGSTTYKRLTTQQATTYTDKAVTGGKTYNYYVIANYKLATGKTVTGNKGDVKSVWYGVNPVETVTAANASNGVKLTWTKRTNAKQYIIMYSTDGTNFKQIATVDGSKLTYTHTAPAWGKTVTYGVRAIFKGNGATYYAPATRKSVVALKQPVLTLKADGWNLMSASWKKSAGATGYNFFYRVKGATNYKKIELSADELFYQFETKDNRVYEAYVTAVVRNKNGVVLNASAKSTVKRATAQGEYAIRTPVIERMEIIGDVVCIEWVMDPMADGYEVILYDNRLNVIEEFDAEYNYDYCFQLPKAGLYHVAVRPYEYSYDDWSDSDDLKYGASSPYRQIDARTLKPISLYELEVIDFDRYEPSVTIKWKSNCAEHIVCYEVYADSDLVDVVDTSECVVPLYSGTDNEEYSVMIYAEIYYAGEEYETFRFEGKIIVNGDSVTVSEQLHSQ